MQKLEIFYITDMLDIINKTKERVEMKVLCNSFLIGLIFFYLNGVSAKSLPDIICVDSQALWDGDFSVEINKDEKINTDTFASIYNQSHEGRFLLKKTKVEVNSSEEKLIFTGKNFSLEIDDPNAEQNLHLAMLYFRDEMISITGSYACMFF